jgi:hypothetical protein
MPCYDGRDIVGNSYHESEMEQAKDRIKWRDAALCAIMTLMEKDKSLQTFLKKIDYKEAGIKQRDLEAWFIEHKREDEIRRETEKRQKEAKAAAKALRIAQEKAREEAIKSLTPEQRKALGI